MSKLESFIREHAITEVECHVPDMAGIGRGKIVPAAKFLRILSERGLRIPESVLVQTVTGEIPFGERISDPASGDVYMVPDPESIRLVPWYPEPTAQVICDVVHRDNSPVAYSSRYLLKRILALYAERDWTPIVAPELEFYLVAKNTDPDYPLTAPVGRSGRTEGGRQAFGIDALNEFDPIFENVYDYCDAQDIDVDTMSHEEGAAQMEINFNHGDPLSLADQVFCFKRTVREAALEKNIYATFMAKPMQDEPGSAMHIHQSVVGQNSRRNLFADTDGSDSDLFMAHIAGLQTHLPAAMPLFAPNVNSYRRLVQGSDAPINVHWGRDNRTTGFRVPHSGPENRRVENRVAGADANPYLAIAASLACGYLGMTNDLEPTDPIKGSAHRLAFSLPRHQTDALGRLQKSKALKEVFGDRFVEALVVVKEAEFEAYQRVISSWERENLLLNV